MTVSADDDEGSVVGRFENRLRRGRPDEAFLHLDIGIVVAEAGENLGGQPHLLVGHVAERNRNRSVGNDEQVVGGHIPGVDGDEAPTATAGLVEGELEGCLGSRGTVDAHDHRRRHPTEQRRG